MQIDSPKNNKVLGKVGDYYKNPAYLLSNESLTIYSQGKTFQLLKSDKNWPNVIAALKAGDWDECIELMDKAAQINNFGAGQVIVKDGQVYYGNEVIHGTIVDRILQFASEGLPIEPLVKFLNNLMTSDSFTVVKELYLFLEDSECPITEDGAFLAYRRCHNDYTSIHANPDGTRNKNKIGDVVKMPRNRVNPDRNQTCAAGLHFCSRKYLPNYGSSSNGDRTMIVKIWPQNVVAIPSDYNNQKGRCCEMEIIGEHIEGDDKPAFTKPLYQATGQPYHNVRDSHGKFVKKS